MPPSLRLALNTLSGKPWRTALMIGAVALAASLIAAFSCAINSVHASMEVGITRIVGAADARIIHQFNWRFNQSVLDQVRAWPEVQIATGRLLEQITLAKAGAQDATQAAGGPRMATPFVVGVELDIHNQFRPTTLLEGSRPTQPNEVLIDPMTAAALAARVGDTLVVQRAGEPIKLIVCGIYERPMLGAVQQPLIEMDRTTLGRASDRTGELTSIAVILKSGQDVNEFCARHQHELPKALLLEPAEKVSAGFDRQVHASRFGFIVGSVLTFVCASFIIVTALTTSVLQRQREMAVARCIGATRLQLFGSQLAAGAVISGAGAAIGIPMGIALAALLTWYFHDLLPAGLRLHWLGLSLALLGSLGAGVLGSLYPAWLASHVAPLKAMTLPAQPPRTTSIIKCAAAGVLLIALQLALLTLSDPETRFFAYVLIGLPALLIGYFMLAVPIVVAVSWLFGPAFSKLLDLPAQMLGRSILATPFRHGFTAGALMVGIAILVSTWSNMTSLLDNWLGKIRFSDGFVFRLTGLNPDQQKAIAALPFVEATCPIGKMPLRVLDRQVFGVESLSPPYVTCVSFDPDVFFSMNAAEWVAGDPATAIARMKDGTGIIVADRFLTTRRVKIGDRLTLGGERIQHEFEIVGAINAAWLEIVAQFFGVRNQYMDFSISCVLMDSGAVARAFDNRDMVAMQLNFDQSVPDKEIIKRIANAAPGAQFVSGRWIMRTIDEVATTMLTVQSSIAFIALGLASLAMGNVILANVHGRRFEFGVLRALGSPRQLLAKLILAEATILALAGAVTGTCLGLHLAWIGAFHYRDLAGLPIHLVVPTIPTAIGWLALIVMATLAALPGVIWVVRRQPSTLLAAGRNG